jgi:hypothetical protein
VQLKSDRSCQTGEFIQFQVDHDAFLVKSGANQLVFEMARSKRMEDTTRFSVSLDVSSNLRAH